jgi:O-antigen/teichoic acid export membrane protein
MHSRARRLATQSRARRVVDAARTNVPEGTFAVGAGLVLAALAGWAYQIFAEKHLGDAPYNAVNALWVTTFVVTPGFFQPLEQEVARAMAARRERGVGGGPVLWKAARLGAVVAAALTVVIVGIAVFAPAVIDQLFKQVDDENVLVVALLVALVTYAIAYLARGTLSGNSRFRNYGLMHGTEGAIRIVAVVLVVASGHASAGWFGLALVIPPIIAVAVSLWGEHGLAEPGPDAPYSEISNALAWLLGSSVLAQALSYAPVLAAQLLVSNGRHDQKLLAGFITAMFLVRVPLLMFQAAYASLLPKLSAHSASGRHDEFRAGLMRLVMVVIAIAAVGVLGALGFGETLGRFIFHEKWTLGNGELALLAAAAGAYIVAFTVAQGLIALQAYPKLTAGWTAGGATFVVVMLVPGDVFTRAEIAFLLSSAVAAVVIFTMLVREMRGKTVPLDELVHVVERAPLEF